MNRRFFALLLILSSTFGAIGSIAFQKSQEKGACILCGYVATMHSIPMCEGCWTEYNYASPPDSIDGMPECEAR